MSDAAALDWLDRLLAADDVQRAASLSELEMRDPELHARLTRLLTHALAPECTRALAAPILDGVAGLGVDATRVLQEGDVLGGYRLIREIGRGGMSVVWLAERADGVVKRAVALKMPMFMMQDAGDTGRFARERAALAALSHPNVARLYDAGVLPTGQPFIVLELIDGVPLTEYCDAKRLDIRSRLQLFLQVLAAVEHAHKHLVVHRDLKPSNILVDRDGQVKLLDFGIAKLLGENESGAPLTQVVGTAMTPLYAAPEQLHGVAVSTLTDVYSAGLVLHELLTGRLPYHGTGTRATLVEILEALRRGALPRASESAIDEVAVVARARPSLTKLRSELTGDLDTIVGKALRVEPDDRYGSVAHFADDLKRYLDRKPIAARRQSIWYSVRLAVERHRLAAATAGIGLVLVVGASVTAWEQYRASRAHAERTAIVRDFMFDLVNDAEADEGQEGEVTGKQMVDGAVVRARRDFDAQPDLQGELLTELGRMYIRLDAPETAIQILEEALAKLEKHVSDADPALNKSRTYLADALLQTGEELPRIRSLAKRAYDGCVTRDAECAKARAYASNILSQVAARESDDESALIQMRRSVAEVRLGFGDTHEAVAMSFLSLAIIARNAGHLIEADDAIRHAAAIAKRVRLGAKDRVTLERTMAIIDFDLGNYAAARDRLLALGAEATTAAERALQARLLANVYVELGEAEKALASANAAIEGFAKDSNSMALAYAVQSRARAIALAGRADAAIADIDEVLKLFQVAGRPSTAFEVLRAERHRAEFLLRVGRTSAAAQALRVLIARHDSVGRYAIERGLALDLLGEAELSLGNIAAALDANSAARAAMSDQLPDRHPFLVRNAALRSRVEN